MSRAIGKTFFWPLLLAIAAGLVISGAELLGMSQGSMLPYYARWGLGGLAGLLFAILVLDPDAHRRVNAYNSWAAAQPQQSGWRSFLPLRQDMYWDWRVSVLALTSWLFGVASMFADDQRLGLLPFICFALCVIVGMMTLRLAPPPDPAIKAARRSRWSFNWFIGD
jgi:hypothetical protein